MFLINTGKGHIKLLYLKLKLITLISSWDTSLHETLIHLCRRHKMAKMAKFSYEVSKFSITFFAISCHVITSRNQIFKSFVIFGLLSFLWHYFALFRQFEAFIINLMLVILWHILAIHFMNFLQYIYLQLPIASPVTISNKHWSNVG